MALTKRAAFTITLFSALFAFTAPAARAADGGASSSVSLQAEIQNIEKLTVKQGSSAKERHDALVRLARLRQLSGDIEGAAKNWLEAAAAIPGTVDDDALLSCAYCLAAMGEFDRAASALEPLLIKSSRARFLDTSIKAIKSGDVSTLAMLAGNSEYAQLKNEIYFMLWKISRGHGRDGNDTWRQKLIAEFPQTPEGRLAAGEKEQTVVVKPSPFWLFMGGLDSLPITVAETAPRPAQKPAAAASAPTAASPAPAAAPASKAVPAPAAPAPKQTPASVPAPAAASTGVKLQTGIFSQQENAQAHIDKLKKAGFSPSLEKRNDKWAVTVPAGSDTNRSIKELKDAGFESFPLK
jgi:cell division septation protein DedD